MALDVSNIQSTFPAASDSARAARAQTELRAALFTPPASPVSADLSAIANDLQRVSAAINRRLSFSVNEKLGKVVVKVIDADTDKVIKEIPPEELQHVYERIREVIGLLLDEQA
jgi:flagellar protein FlaG